MLLLTLYFLNFEITVDMKLQRKMHRKFLYIYPPIGISCILLYAIKARQLTLVHSTVLPDLSALICVYVYIVLQDFFNFILK